MIDESIFMGPYLKVKTSEEKVEYELRCCVNPDCEKHKIDESDHSYCSKCGRPTEKITESSSEPINLFELIEKELGADCFIILDKEEESDILILPNKDNQGGKFIDPDSESREYSLIAPNNPKYFSQRDWKMLFKVLEKKGLSYQKKIGLVIWYS